MHFVSFMYFLTYVVFFVHIHISFSGKVIFSEKFKTLILQTAVLQHFDFDELNGIVF